MDPTRILFILIAVLAVAIYYVYTVATVKPVGNTAGTTVANLSVSPLTPTFKPVVTADSVTLLTSRRISSNGLPDQFEIDFVYTPTAITSNSVAVLTTAIVPVSGFNTAKLQSWSCSGYIAGTTSTAGNTIYSMDLVASSDANTLNFSFPASVNTAHIFRLRISCAL